MKVYKFDLSKRKDPRTQNDRLRRLQIKKSRKKVAEKNATILMRVGKWKNKPRVWVNNLNGKWTYRDSYKYVVDKKLKLLTTEYVVWVSHRVSGRGKCIGTFKNLTKAKEAVRLYEWTYKFWVEDDLR